jgi:cathepsin C
LVDEDCAPYIGKHDKCPAACRDKTRHYATDYKYINGYYGAVNVKGMMLEIYKNGPIVAGFTVYREMYNYRSGIYKSNGWLQGNEPIDINRPHTASAGVNHAVLIVGWGTDSLGHKYWIVRNSWGRSWGMDGFITAFT